MRRIIESFKVIDALMLFIAIVFGLSAYIAISISTVMVIFMLSFSIIQITYVVLTIRIRMRLNQDLKLERDALSATEQVFEKNAGSEYNNIKQKILESMVEKTLLSAFPSAYVLKNIFVPKKSGGTTEIDVMMINNDGIFLFEAKNINATLKGDWSKNKIVAEYPNGSHIEIDNPVLQNSTHFTHVANLVSKTKPHLIKNIVVLGPDTKVVRPEFMTIPSYAAITTIPSLVYTVNRRAQVSRNILSNEEVKSISEIFETYLGYTDEKMEQHIQNIKH